MRVFRGFLLIFLIARAALAQNFYYNFVKAIYYIDKGNYQKASKLLKETIEERPRNIVPRLELIKLYLSSGRWLAAYQEAKKTAKLFPKSYKAHLLLGKSALAIGKTQEAEKALKRAVSLEKDKEALSLLMETLIRSGKIEEVEGYARDTIKLFPNSPMGFYYLGRYYLEKKSYEKAEENLKRAIKLSPYFLSPYKELGELYLKMGKLKEAAKIYEKLLKFNPHSIEAMEKLLNIYIRLKETKKAEKILEKMNRVLGPHLEINKKLALIYMENGEYEKAEKLLRRILKENPEDDYARYYLSAVLIEENKTQEAIDEILKISPASPIFDTSRATLISILYRAGKRDEAKKLLVLSLKRKPNSTILLKILADFYMDEKDYRNALKAIDRVLKLDPKDLDALYKKGLILEKTGKRKEALKVMRDILKVDPDNPDALNFIGYCYAEEGKSLEEAKEMIEKALKQRPNDGYILDSMGWVYYKMGKYKEAYKWLKKALEKKPSDPVINEHMGDILVKMGRDREALDFYRISEKLFRERGEEKEAKRVEEKMEKLTGKSLEINNY